MLSQLPELLPTTSCFYPAFTLLGSQPTVVVALRSGLIVKLNRPGAERVVHSPPLHQPKGLAAAAEIQKVCTTKRMLSTEGTTSG